MTDDTLKTTGGCLCSGVRFEASMRITGALFCHCRMCQRASGSAFSLNVVYPRSRLVITQGEPSWHHSSKIADRGFCPGCGTPLFVRYSVAEWENWIAVSLGAHDYPEHIPAERHFGVESQLPCVQLADDLPKVSYPDSFLNDVATGHCCPVN